ncbi:hypothetical protein BC940DRAFT_279508 [Gongronella butleri]|nr:hypothetical protein BC940DRAFT_279508 [Gongronella butleri]
MNTTQQQQQQPQTRKDSSSSLEEGPPPVRQDGASSPPLTPSPAASPSASTTMTTTTPPPAPVAPTSHDVANSIYQREPSIASTMSSNNHDVVRPRDLLPDFRNLGHQQHGIKTELATSDAHDIIHALQLAEQKSTDISLKDEEKDALHAAMHDDAAGALPAQQQQHQRIPASSRIGWTAFSDRENPGGALPILATEKKPASDVDNVLAFLYYSSWWREGGAVFAIGIASWTLARLGAGMVLFLIVLLFIAVYSHRTTERFRANTRDDIKRNLCTLHLEGETEPVEWLNSFLQNFWLIFEPVLSAYVVENIDTYLVDYLPSFLDSVRLTAFTLGNKPFRVDSVRMLDAQDDTVCMDWIVSFEPNDTTRMTQKQLSERVSPRVQLQIRLGKGFVGAALPVLVEDMSFHGHMRVKMQFISKFPHVKIVEACFMEKPEFDYVLKPLGGDTFGFDVNNIPGLQGFVREQAHAILGPMMYYPNVFSYDIEKFFSGELDISQANGVLAVTVYGISTVGSSDIPGGKPNMSLRFYLDKAQELGRTSNRKHTQEPAWNETHFLLLNNLNAKLTLELRNESGNSLKDHRIARGHFDLNELKDEDDGTAEGLDLDLLRKGRRITTCHVDMRYLPVAKTTVAEDGTTEPALDSNSGVLRFTVHECRNLHGGRTNPNPYAVVKVNGVEKIRTPTFKRTDMPKFERSGEVVVLDRTQVNVSVTIMNNVDFAEDVSLGTWSSALVPIMQWQDKNESWWDLQVPSGATNHGTNGTNHDATQRRSRIRFSVQWKPVDMTSLITVNSILGSAVYREAIGIVRFSMWEARDLLNVEAVRGSKSDPYVRVMSGSQVRARTQVIDNNLFPEWGEFHYVPIHSMRENLVLEVMDWNAKSKDKLLGSTVLRIKDLVQEHHAPKKPHAKHNDQIKWYEQREKIDKWVSLKSPNGKTNKGALRYTAEFYPTLAVPPRDQPDHVEKEELTQNIDKSKAEDANEDAKEVHDASEEPAQPEGPTNGTMALGDTASSFAVKDLHGVPIKWTPDQMVDVAAYSTGVLMVRIHEVQLPHSVHAYCAVLVDSLYPLYRTASLQGGSLPFNEPADAFIKEMDFSRVHIDVVPVNVDSSKEDDRYGYWAGSVSEIVRRIQARKRHLRTHHKIQDQQDQQEKQNPAELDVDDATQEDQGEWFDLMGVDDGIGRIRLSFDFMPLVGFELNMDESLENQGNLTVTLLDAKHVMAADKSGTSDPYVRFTINGERVYKSPVIKKTLNPVWKNAQFTIPILSRVTSSFRIEVFDWNQIKGDYPLGSGGISLRNEYVESFLARDVLIPLEGEKNVSGHVRVRFLWQPQLLTTRKTHTSMLQTMRTMTYRGTMTSKLASGATLAPPQSDGQTTKSVSPPSTWASSPPPLPPSSPTTHRNDANAQQQQKQHDEHVAFSPDTAADTSDDHHMLKPRPSTSSLSSTSSRRRILSALSSPSSVSLSRHRQSIQSLGTVTVHLLSARNLPGVDKSGTSDPYVQVRMNNHTLHKSNVIKKSLTPEWNESFHFELLAKDCVVEYRVKDHNRFSQSVKLGTYEQDFGQLHDLYTNHTWHKWVNLQPQGELQLRLEFTPH